jgi:hypothetical protein
MPSFEYDKLIEAGVERIMGVRIYFSANCAYCGKTNSEIYYAPSFGFITHNCEYCKRINKIVDFKLEKMVGCMSGVWHTCKKCGCYCELTGHLECSECNKRGV